MYIYQADVYCDDCGEKIRANLDSIRAMQHDRAFDKDDSSSYDSDDYPKGPFNDSDEADSPQHCGACHVFLENSLTSDGYDYVVDQALRDDGNSEVLDEWLRFYNLEYDSQPCFDRFDICEAYYLFASQYHAGQGSREYAIFGRLDRLHFKPRPRLSNYQDLSENGRGIFINLVRKQLKRANQRARGITVSGSSFSGRL